jgi:hypothetical protein
MGKGFLNPPHPDPPAIIVLVLPSRSGFGACLNISGKFFGKSKKYPDIFRLHRIQGDQARAPFVTPTAFKSRQKVFPLRTSRRLGFQWLAVPESSGTLECLADESLQLVNYQG